jgi:carboxylesterase type B
LFLDVMVPRGVFDNRDSRPNGAGKGAAVMVWLFEGGFGAGSKYDTPPAGLISRSQIGHGEGIIYVALNYRL